MQITKEFFEEITEGKTKLQVPKKSLTDTVPPKEPAFFNPKAKLNRDFSILAYGAFLKKFEGPKIFLEGLSGIGARGLRSICEEIMRDAMYELPSKRTKKFMLTLEYAKEKLERIEKLKVA